MNPRRSCEDQLSALFDYEYAVLFGRARSGLVAIVEEVGGRSSPVLTPSNICAAVVTAIAAAGAVPIAVPVSPESGLVDDTRLATAIENNRSPLGIAMPAHLYGMLGTYDETRHAASVRSWFVLENDSLAATNGLQRRTRAAGDALLLSFGGGKTIDAQGGGAILTNDRSLAAAISRRAREWPPLRDQDETVEMNLIMARRFLYALERPGVSESLMDVDIASSRLRFDDSLRPRLSKALAEFSRKNELRRCRLERWQAELEGLRPALDRPSLPLRTPWRAVFRFADGPLRDDVVTALRADGFDAGTNYPPLTHFFPQLLKGQEHEDAERWGRTVVTLWLSDAYDDDRIAQAASVIRKIVDKSVEARHTRG